MLLNEMNVMRITKQQYTVQCMLDQQQMENVVYFIYVGSMITNDTRYICEIKSRIAIAKTAFNKKKAPLISKWTSIQGRN
jgi:hypothetical protein